MIGCAVSLWFVLQWILATDRGLDLTDEGLYLLAADPPSDTATWGFPSGWHTAPFFRLAGYDIANFRTLGAVILVMSGMAFGIVLSNFALLHLAKHWTVTHRAQLATLMSGVFIAGLGSMFYYAGLLRTPSYNWVNLVGILIAATGQISMLSLLIRDAQQRLIQFVGPLVATSFGLFFSFPAKPSTAVFLSLAFFALLWLLCGVKKAVVWVGVTTIVTLVMMVVAVIVGLWPRSFIDVFVNAVTFPTPLEIQQLSGAFKSLLVSPAFFALDIYRPLFVVGTIAGIVVLFAAICLTVIALLPHQPPEHSVRAIRNVRVTVIIGLLLVGLHRLNISVLGFLAEPIYRWVYFSISTVALALIAVVWIVGNGWAPDVEPLKAPAFKLSLLLTGYLVLLSFIFGFGSGHGAYRQTSLAVMFFFLAAFVLCFRIRSKKLASLTGVALLGVVALGVASTLVDSWKLPYRISPITSNKIPTFIGRHEAPLLLDPDLHEFLTEFRQQAEAQGWVRDTPLLGAQWRWASTIPYFLEARVPESLMLTLSADVEIASFHLTDSTLENASETPWLLISNDRAVPEAKKSTVEALLVAIEKYLGREFPESFTCVASAADTQLWRPIEFPEESAECPEPVPFSSAYDLDDGFQYR